MKQIVVNVEDNYNAKDGDVIVYNAKSGKFEIVAKEVFLNELNVQVKSILKVQKIIKENIKCTNENVAKIAKIVKENIK